MIANQMFAQCIATVFGKAHKTFFATPDWTLCGILPLPMNIPTVDKKCSVGFESFATFTGFLLILPVGHHKTSEIIIVPAQNIALQFLI